MNNQGERGERGDHGQRGETGARGATGETGARGEKGEIFISPPLLPSVTVYEDEPKSKFSLQGFLLIVLVVMMSVQVVYLITYSQNLRKTQEVLVCQSYQTEQLRVAARIERVAMRDLLGTPPAADPNDQAEKQRIAKDAVEKYIAALDASDEARELAPKCPALPSSNS